MREKLNSNPLLQAALVGVLLVGTGFFVLSSMGGGKTGSGESAETEATVTISGTTSTEPVESGTPTAVPSLPPGAAGAAPPPPRPVTRAFDANSTVVLLFVRNGGIDDRLVRDSVKRLNALPRVSPFVVPADDIARYAAITQGVAVDRVPALVVVRPKRLDGDIPVASVYHGFQSPESVVQAVIDAGYKGRTLDYHP